MHKLIAATLATMIGIGGATAQDFNAGSFIETVVETETVDHAVSGDKVMRTGKSWQSENSIVLGLGDESVVALSGNATGAVVYEQSNEWTTLSSFYNNQVAGTAGAPAMSCITGTRVRDDVVDDEFSAMAKVGNSADMGSTEKRLLLLGMIKITGDKVEASNVKGRCAPTTVIAASKAPAS